MMTGASELNAERLVKKLRSGDQQALARALTLVENGGPQGNALLHALRGDYGAAQIIGFTGPPGAGKSTLVGALIHEWRKDGTEVAILAVDPVSPLSGGAVLGDRTRMGAHTLDDGVFIRSVSARGHLGGLCATAHDMADVMAAAGWPLILIETVGAGQSETEIAQVADLSVVISAPGLGDDLQAIKAGILEIGDVLVVNKCDREGADQTAKQLEAMLKLRTGERRNVPVNRVSAATGAGLADLKATIEEQLEKLGSNRQSKRNAHKLATTIQQLANRISAGISQQDLAAPGSQNHDKAIRQSLAALVAELDR